MNREIRQGLSKIILMETNLASDEISYVPSGRATTMEVVERLIQQPSHHQDIIPQPSHHQDLSQKF